MCAHTTQLDFKMTEYVEKYSANVLLSFAEQTTAAHYKSDVTPHVTREVRIIPR